MKILIACLFLCISACSHSEPPIPTALVSSYAAATLTLYISPRGNDNWSGTIKQPNSSHNDGPLASLQGARDAIRRLKKNSQFNKAIHVVLDDGIYPMTAPVVFTPEDSGSQAAPIVYAAAQNAKPRFMGGQVIAGLKPAQNGLWVATVPEVKSGKLYFEQLFINGRFATRARSPNTLYYYMRAKLGDGVDPLTGSVTDLSKRAFLANADDIRPLTQLSPAQLKDVNVVAYHSWQISRHFIASIDTPTNTVFVSSPAPRKFLEFGPSQRFYVDNFKQALDTAGEWFLDRDGTLYYKPLPDESPSTVTAVIPVTDQFIRIEGLPEQNAFVEYLQFKGLGFEFSKYSTPPQGYSGPQADAALPAALVVNGARHINITDCEVSHTSAYAIWLRRGVTDSSIEHCYLHALGGGGIKVGETQIDPNPDNRSGHIRIENTIIRSGGRLFPGSVGIFIAQSGDNVIAHNDIGDLYYSGISVGWTWGYGTTLSVRNRIEYNHVHDIGLGVLSDLGGIYTLGLSTGSTISHNVVHDIFSYDRYGQGGWGIYTDEGGSGIVVENNLAYNTATGGYTLNYGERNIVRNNIFLYGKNSQVRLNRPEDHLSVAFENNIVSGNPQPIFAGSWNNGQFMLRRNLFASPAGNPLLSAASPLADWQRNGTDNGSVAADPKFFNAEQHDFRLQADSAAFALGFKPFDYAQAGVYGDPGWIQLAKADNAPALESAPVPMPAKLTLSEDFEASALGGQPPFAVVKTGGGEAGIRVVNETAAGGRQSLKIQDAPNLGADFFPYFFYEPQYRSGLGTFAFDVRTEPGAVISHQWRDWPTNSGSYAVGPSLEIQNGQLRAGNAVNVALPISQWVHIEISADIGSPQSGTWTLRITPPGSPPLEFKQLPFANPHFQTLNWLGFASQANGYSAYYLDNLRLRNIPSIPLTPPAAH